MNSMDGYRKLPMFLGVLQRIGLISRATFVDGLKTFITRLYKIQ